MENTPKLLPCPFCGGAASIHDTEVGGYSIVRCDNPPCPTQPYTSGYTTTAVAIEDWNTRIKPVDDLPADSFTRYYYLATYAMTMGPRQAITPSDIYTKEISMDTLVTTIEQFNAMENSIARELIGKPGLGNASVKLINLDFLGQDE